MPKKIINLRAFFKSYNYGNKKLTMNFLDDEVEPFTKKFLMSYFNWNQNNPVKDNEFYVKSSIKSKACVDKHGEISTTIQELVDTVVCLQVEIRHYNFSDKKTNNRIIGWNLNLINIYPA
jgi:hypothetical protein